MDKKFVKKIMIKQKALNMIMKSENLICILQISIESICVTRDYVFAVN